MKVNVDKIPLGRNVLLRLILVLLLLPLFSCSLPNKKAGVTVPNLGFDSIYTLDLYQDGQRVHLLASGQDKTNDVVSLKYVYTDNQGYHWSEAVEVNQPIAPVKKSVRGNDFQIAVNGPNIVAAWQTVGSVPWAGVITLAISNDHGLTWRRLESPISDDFSMIDQGYFDLAADNKGYFHLTWLDDRDENGNYQVLRYARLAAEQPKPRWAFYKELDDSVCTCCWTKVVTDKQAAVNVLFRDDKPKDMVLLRSGNRGESWQAADTIAAFNWDFIGCPHQGGSLVVVSSEDKKVMHSIIWNGSQENLGAGLYYSRLLANETKWSTAMPIKKQITFSGDIAAQDDQNIAMVYRTGTGRQKRIEMTRSMDAGNTWSEPKQISSSGTLPSHPRLLGNAHGYLVFWTAKSANGDTRMRIAKIQ